MEAEVDLWNREDIQASLELMETALLQPGARGAAPGFLQLLEIQKLVRGAQRVCSVTENVLYFFKKLL